MAVNACDTVQSSRAPHCQTVGKRARVWSDCESDLYLSSCEDEFDGGDGGSGAVDGGPCVAASAGAGAAGSAYLSSGEGEFETYCRSPRPLVATDECVYGDQAVCGRASGAGCVRTAWGGGRRG